MDSIGKALVVAGLLISAVGAIVWLAPQRPQGGWLPGDISFDRGGVRFFFPVVSCIALSAVATLLLWLFRK